MHSIRLLVAVLLAGFCFSTKTLCIEPVNPNLNPTARKVLKYLDSVYQTRTLCGYNVYVHTPDDYEQTGMQAAIWGRDMQWLGDPVEIAEHAKRYRYILTLHWHWYFDEDSAWTGKRKTKVDVGKMVTPGTQEYKQAITEMAAAAEKLQVFEDSDIPVLWRPLHEIDGGWFWWTDKKTPENTARLWRMMYEYLTNTRKLDNLIWVYSAGVGKGNAEYRSRFYPGKEYVDISGIDIYGVDFRKDVDKYWEYYNVMSKVSPGKMLACGECDAIPDPVKMQSGKLPKWLYALPWWGTPSGRRPADWAVFTMRHDFIITLDEIPAFGAGNIAPHIGILEPLDDGSAWYVQKPCVIKAYAVDRDGKVARVKFYANGRLIGTDDAPPYTFTWSGAPIGCHNIRAEAVDDKGEKTMSNAVRVSVGLVDLARDKPVVASSGKSPENAVDGDYHTTWSSDKSDDEWIYVDLGGVQKIKQVNLLWGWKIHAQDYSIDAANADPEKAESWKTIHSQTGCAYQTWEATYHIHFAPTSARYVRMHAKKRAGGQTWGGYQLAAFEVPVPSDVVGLESEIHEKADVSYVGEDRKAPSFSGGKFKKRPEPKDFALKAETVQAGFFTPARAGRIWDTWIYHHNGKYYMYYLAGPGGHWDGHELATSEDGVHWKEQGVMIKPRAGVTWMGTGHIWKSPDFAKNHQWVMNYSECCGDKQDIMFATSTDLLNWTKVDEKYRFVQDVRWYKAKGRWDCIDTVRRDDGSLYGYFTANPIAEKVPYRPCGFGFARSRNGITWEALPPVKGDISGEFGGIQKLADKFYILISEGRVAVGDKPEGPFFAQKKNPNAFGKGCNIYFPRFFHNAPGGPLVNHFYTGGTVFAAPLKDIEIDREGILRLKWWKNNDKLKAETVETGLVVAGAAYASSLRMLDKKLDLNRTNVIEGTVGELPLRAPDGRKYGIFFDHGDGHGQCLLPARNDVQFGEIKADGSDLKIKQTTSRDMEFGPTVTFRLVIKLDMMELYVNDYLMNLKRVKCNGQIGFIGANDEGAFRNIKVWQSD